MLSEESLWFRSFTSQVLYYVFCKMQWVLKKILVSDGENRCFFALAAVCDRAARLLLSRVDLRQTALAGFPEAVVQIDAGFVHSPAHHIIADITRACEEEA